MRLKGKVRLMMTLLIGCVMAITIALTTIALERLGNTIIGRSEATMMKNYDEKIAEQVEMIDRQVKGVKQDMVQGKITFAEGTRRAEHIIRSARYGESGYFWADDLEGNNIVSLGDPTVEGKNRLNMQDDTGFKIVAEMISLVKEEGEGYVDYLMKKIGEDEAEPKRAYVKLNEEFNWVIGTGNYVDDMRVYIAQEREALQKVIKDTIAIFVIISIILMTIGIMIAETMIRSITHPILKASTYLESIGHGDFTLGIEEKYLKRKDEIGIIVKSIDEMKNRFKQLASTIQNESYEIENKVELVMADMSSLSNHLQEVAATTEELAAGMEETSASSQQMAVTSTEIEKAVASIAKRSEEGATAANAIHKRADQTKANVHQAEKRTKEMLGRTQGVLKQAIEDTKVVEKIDILTKSIMQIVEQTNLLALNAAIEAARAGEAGRGFSIVAEEIRKLADQSKKAVLEIQEVIPKVKSSVVHLTSSSDQLLGFVSDDVRKDYEMMLEVTSRYSEDANYVNDLVTDFSATSQELLASVQNILESIEGVAAAADEGAMGTSDIANRIAESNERGIHVAGEVIKAKVSTEELKRQINHLKF